MKIVYCTNSVCYAGGLERVIVSKANALASIEGNQIWIVVSDNKHPLPFYLDRRVQLIDLDVNYFDDDWKSKWHNIKGIIVKRKIHKERILRVLNQIKPDIVISTNRSEKYFLPKLRIVSRPSFIREIHTSSNYRTFLSHGFFSRFIARLTDLYDYKLSIKGYDKIVLLSEEDRLANWKGNTKAISIPNPVFVKIESCSDLSNKIVMAAGRLSGEKNFSSLIRAWDTVKKKHPNWILNIWGEGAEKILLQELIDKLDLQDSVFLKGYANNIMSEYVKASVFVLSSLIEGFGLVIIEAMSCGLPVVSYQCPCGPKDIISDGKDGFLVPVNDEDLLADRICYLIGSQEKRIEMGRNALEKAKQYSMEVIVKKWMDLFEELQTEKRRNSSF